MDPQDGNGSRGSRTAWLVGLPLAALVAFAIGVWRAEPPQPPGEGAGGEPGGAPEAPASPTPPGPAKQPAADFRIPDRGRLSLEAKDLPASGSVAIALDLPDEARGAEARSVQVASTDGRALQTVATIEPGEGSGVRIQLDAAWLAPGRYMIQVETNEKTHFPLRRYVLEVRQPGAQASPQ